MNKLGVKVGDIVLIKENPYGELSYLNHEGIKNTAARVLRVVGIPGSAAYPELYLLNFAHLKEAKFANDQDIERIIDDDLGKALYAKSL